MKVSETALLESGFSHAEIQKINKNVELYGGTLEEAINDLSRRFSTLMWVTVVFVVIFFFLCVFSTPIKALAGGISFAIGFVLMAFAQPFGISYKSWRYRKNING